MDASTTATSTSDPQTFRLTFKTLTGGSIEADVPSDATIERMKEFFIAAQVGAPDPDSYLYDGTENADVVRKMREELAATIGETSGDIPRELVDLIFDFCYVVVRDEPLRIDCTRVIHAGKRLIDDRSMKSFGIKNDSVIHVVFRLRAGAGPSSSASNTQRPGGGGGGSTCAHFKPPRTTATASTNKHIVLSTDAYKLDPQLTRNLRALQPSNFSRTSSLATSSGEKIFKFEVLDVDICRRLYTEALRWARDHTHEPLGEVNTKKLQIHEHIANIARRCILPSVLPKEAKYHPMRVKSVDSVIFCESDENPLQSLSIGDDGKASKLEVGTVPWHTDASDYTINLCLAGDFDDQTSKVIFDGAELRHCASHGAVHKGSLRHRVTKCVGWRTNLLMFVNLR